MTQVYNQAIAKGRGLSGGQDKRAASGDGGIEEAFAVHPPSAREARVPGVIEDRDASQDFFRSPSKSPRNVLPGAAWLALGLFESVIRVDGRGEGKATVILLPESHLSIGRELPDEVDSIVVSGIRGVHGYDLLFRQDPLSSPFLREPVAPGKNLHRIVRLHDRLEAAAPDPALFMPKVAFVHPGMPREYPVVERMALRTESGQNGASAGSAKRVEEGPAIARVLVSNEPHGLFQSGVPRKAGFHDHLAVLL